MQTIIEFTPTTAQIIRWRNSHMAFSEQSCRCPVTQALAAALKVDQTTLLNAGPATGTIRLISVTRRRYMPATEEDVYNVKEFIRKVDDDKNFAVEDIKIPTLKYIV